MAKLCLIMPKTRLSQSPLYHEECLDDTIMHAVSEHFITKISHKMAAAQDRKKGLTLWHMGHNEIPSILLLKGDERHCAICFTIYLKRW